MTPNAAAEVEARLVAEKPGKPPLLYLTMDVRLRNGADAPRWFVFPSTLPIGPGGPSAEGGGVNEVEVLQLEGEGPLVIGRFLGTGDRYALRLAAGAEVRIRDLPVKFWGRAGADEIAFEVQVAPGLTVGDADAATWFGGDPTSPARADVGGGRAVRVHETPDRGEVKLAAVAARSIPVRVKVPEELVLLRSQP